LKGCGLLSGQTARTELLQTPLEGALQWAEKGEPDQQIQAFVPGREERFSYAALQPVSGILWYWQYFSSFSGFILGPNSVIGNSL
jgi:hypothetical protein